MRHTLLVLIVFFFGLSCDKNDDDCEKPQCCKLKPDAGQCEAYILRDFYNSSTGKCEEFIWGGCGGTVPFEILEACYECECDWNKNSTPFLNSRISSN